MEYQVIIHNAEGTNEVLLYESATLSAVRLMALQRLEGGTATRVDIFDVNGEPVEQHPVPA